MKLKCFSKKEVVVPVENNATILNMESQGPIVMVSSIIFMAI